MKMLNITNKKSIGATVRQLGRWHADDIGPLMTCGTAG